MHLWLSDQARLFVLIVMCAALWSIESVIPLKDYKKYRVRRAVPNIGLTILLIFTSLLLSFASAELAAFTAHKQIGLFFLVQLPMWLLALLGIAMLDLFGYVAHVSLHKSRLGWQFHRVHHSEIEVDVTTAFRQHPLETIWRILWQLLGIVTFGLPLWVLFIYLMMSAINAQLEHANIRVNRRVDRLLRLLFVTPDMHKVHHSREQRETDSNYSNIFSIWDRLCHTYTSQVNLRDLRFGLDGFDDRRKQSLRALLLMPFFENF